MNRLFSFIKFIAMGSLTLVLTACYGVIDPIVAVMYGVPYRLLSGRVRIKDRANNPIPGLEVVINEYYSYSDTEEKVTSTITDSNGYADFEFDDYYSDYNIDVIDSDGDLNGGTFEFTTETFSNEELEDYFDIELNLDEAEDIDITRTFVDSNGEPQTEITIEIVKKDDNQTAVLIDNNIPDINGVVTFTLDTSYPKYELTIKDIETEYVIKSVTIDLDNPDDISQTLVLEN